MGNRPAWVVHFEGTNGEQVIRRQAVAAAILAAVEPGILPGGELSRTEDYEYMKLLAARGQKGLADQLARDMASSWTQWETDPQRLYSLREQMGNRLSESKP
jgi:hypothetical protein